MKTETETEIRKRIATKIERYAIDDVLRICKSANIPISEYETEIHRIVSHLVDRRSYGVLLSAYSNHGQISDYTPEFLLKKMFEVGDYPSFLKQAHRFGFYDELRDEIESAISWHEAKNAPDTEAWKRKFLEINKKYEGA